MPEAFGRYWLHEKIGHGGMAEIYRATIGPNAQTYAFDLAIKRLHVDLAGDPEQVEMFFTEAEVARFLNHPNVVQVFESGQHNNIPFIAMEYIWGFDLATLIQNLRRRRVRLTLELAVYVAQQTLRALDYVHQAIDPRGNPMYIVHRDVTPSNIYVTFNGEVKLGDFGVACILAQDLREEVGVLRGKLSYMPPEVLAGRPIDHYVDLWSLAVTLYELLTGRHVYDDDVEEADLIGGHLRPKIVPAHKINPEVDPALSKILTRALSFKRRRRPDDATTFYRQLKHYLLGQGIQVEPKALGRFVSLAAGNDTHVPAEPRSTAAPQSDFDAPEYQAPVEFSPTQRYEVIRRRRFWRRGPVVLGAVAVASAAFGALIGRHPGREDQSVSASPAPQQAAVPPEAAPVITAPSPPSAAEVPRNATPPGVGAEPRPAPSPPTSPPTIDADVWAGTIDFGDEIGESPPQGSDGTPDKDKNRFKSLMHRGRVQVKRGRFESAAEAYKKATSYRPSSLAAQLGWARALYELGRYDQAAKLAERVTRQSPDAPRALFLLGSILRAKGDNPGAKRAFERCARVDPEGRFGTTAEQILNAW